VGGSQQGTLTRNAGATKEAEVDALTNLLVQSMDGNGDSDVYGMYTLNSKALTFYLCNPPRIKLSSLFTRISDMLSH